MEWTTTTQQTRTSGGYQSRTNLVLLAFLAIGVFFLLTEHTAHVFGILPYLLLLLCPLLHLLHGGHGSNHASQAEHHRQPSEGEQR